MVTGRSEEPDVLWEFQQPEIMNMINSEEIRLVGLRRNPNEPLVCTFVIIVLLPSFQSCILF